MNLSTSQLSLAIIINPTTRHNVTTGCLTDEVCTTLNTGTRAATLETKRLLLVEQFMIPTTLPFDLFFASETSSSSHFGETAPLTTAVQVV